MNDKLRVVALAGGCLMVSLVALVAAMLMWANDLAYDLQSVTQMPPQTTTVSVSYSDVSSEARSVTLPLCTNRVAYIATGCNPVLLQPDR